MSTQKQRDAYRYALEDKGVPEVIAFMAAQAANDLTEFDAGDSAEALIYLHIWWANTPQGYHFWQSVSLCAESRK